MQHERFVTDVNGVAGIRSALIAHHPIRALGKDIDKLALAFISPLGADDHDSTRIRIEHCGRREAGGG